MPRGVAIFVSSRADGNMSFDWGPAEAVRAARSAFLSRQGIPFEDCVTMRVGNEALVTVVDGTARRRGMSTADDAVPGDALITREPGLRIFLHTGDCLPLVLCDPVRGTIGMGHGSRRSLDAGLPRAMVAAFEREFGSRPEDLEVWIGPGARKDSYLLIDPPQKTKPAWKEFLGQASDGNTAVDLAGYAVAEFAAHGVPAGRIEIDPRDTIASNALFSHYRDSRAGKPEGRFATVIGLT